MGIKNSLPATLKVDINQNQCILEFTGSFTLTEAKGNEEVKTQVYTALNKGNFQRIVINAKELKEWDVTLLAFLVCVYSKAQKNKILIDDSSLDSKARELVDLALTVAARPENEKQSTEQDFLEAVGDKVLRFPKKFKITWDFMQEIGGSCLRILQGKSQLNKRELWQAIQECGVEALPIVSLTSLLLGLILAFVGAIQLRMFGAEIYIASLVALSMVRIMGALLTGIVLSGRTGANFAAVLGSMQVNEEIDALKTFGISPFDFLVMPRLIALTLMTPLLALYSMFMGIIGGFFVGIFMLKITATMYIDSTIQFLSLSYLWIGLFHAFVFGIVIAIAGCFQGYYCGRSAEAVGKATTLAVVNSIVGIIVATSIITVFLTLMGL